MPEHDGGPDPVTRPGGVGVGTVADETARLLEALLGLAPGAAPEPPGRASADDGEREETASEEAASADGASETSPEAPCPTCGHVDAGGAAPQRAAEVCHLCPVCQVLRVVRSVRPETLDRLADLAAAVTESLRDAAAERWRSSGAAGEAAGGTRSGPAPARPSVQDIPVADDDGPGQDQQGSAWTDDLEDIR